MSQILSKLRVVSEQLSSTKTEDLPGCIPTLVANVLQCGKVLSAAHDAKSKASSQTYTLVHKLKTQISTLLSGKTAKARFSGAALTKAVIDVGGRECLQTSEPWTRSLIGMLQKSDPLPCKEIAVVALTKIYLLAQEHQTLVREIATPTLPDFIQVCLQLSNKADSLVITEAICSSFSILIPLYPATFRPFTSQIRSQVRPFLAPTSCDDVLVPTVLRKTARGVMSLLSHSSAKNGSSEEWAALVQGLLKSLHLTADQVFRCVDEQWVTTTFGYTRAEVNFNHEPSGGGASPEDLPLWIGMQAGGARLSGLLDFMAAMVRTKTKAPVAVPLPSILEICTRISYITPFSSAHQRPSGGLEYDPNASREEKDLLSVILPDIHTSTTLLLDAIVERMGHLVLPHFSEALDQVIRLFNICREVPSLRKAVYNLAVRLLSLGGNTLERQAVGALQPLILGVCRELHAAAGHLAELEREDAARKNFTKTNPGTNVDRFLTNPSALKNGSTTAAPESIAPVPLSEDTQQLVSAAESLLISVFTNVPQEHFNAPLRNFMDQTAVTCRSKSAMIASVLNPYPGQDGKFIPSVLPYLVQQFPDDQAVELLRTNVQTKKAVVGDLYWAGEEDGEMLKGEGQTANGDELGDSEIDEDNEAETNVETAIEEAAATSIPARMVKNLFATRSPSPTQEQPPTPKQEEAAPTSPLKRKFEQEEKAGGKDEVQPAKKEKKDDDTNNLDDDEDDDEEIELHMALDEDLDSDLDLK